MILIELGSIITKKNGIFALLKSLFNSIKQGPSTGYELAVKVGSLLCYMEVLLEGTRFGKVRDQKSQSTTLPT